MASRLSATSHLDRRPDRPLRVVLLNWRDSGHPEGGGSEVYGEHVADGLASMGHDVTLFTATYPGAPAAEMRPSGTRVVRRGSHQSVYLQAAAAFRRGRLGHPDVIVEVHSGMPFLARLWAGRVPVVVLVHHVHREQWPVVFGPMRARVGWLLESRVAPRVNRGCRYVAVSEVTRDELGDLGIEAARVDVIRNGTTAPPPGGYARTTYPSLLVLGRLVPHKRVEIAIETLARLRGELPDLRLTVAGKGWWDARLRDCARATGVENAVDFAGFVDDETRHRLYSESWVSLVPSVKEGWGLVVVEAGAHGTPTVAFRGAGGVAESVVDGSTGLLAEHGDIEDFAAKTRRLLLDEPLRSALGADAATYARRFSWDTTVKSFAVLLERVAGRG